MFPAEPRQRARLFSASPSTLYTSLSAWNLLFASGSGFLSGWSLRQSILYAFLISVGEAVFSTPSTCD